MSSTNRQSNNNNFQKRNKNNSRPSIAIIGGGISGLSCAQQLATSTKYDVTVYDTGRLRPGGRCASRQPGDPIKPSDDTSTSGVEYPILSQYRYDHAAQLISTPANQGQVSTSSAFSKQLQQWEADGIVQKFPSNSVYTISKNGKVQSIPDQTFWYGKDGMGNIPLAMVNRAKKSANFALEQDTWVSPSSGVRYQKNSGTWKLQANGKTLGYYDQLIIAHNGKCADRIMSKTPATDVHSLLRVNFNPTVPANGGKKMTLNSLYSVTVALPLNSEWSKALPPDFICGMVLDNHPTVRSLTCQTKKYPSSGEHEVWTILSSATFGKRHKAPQEFLPPEVVEEVTTLLVQAVDGILKTCVGGTPKDYDADQDTKKKVPTKKSQVLEKRVQLWGAAVPLNVWRNEQGFLYDSTNNVGVVGDWLVEPSIGGAWTSGYQLAQHLLQDKQETAGLEGGFERSESVKSAGIAAFPQVNDKMLAN